LEKTPAFPAPRDLPDAAISFGPFRLLTETRALLEGERPVALGSRALEVLIALASRPGELVTKEELVADVWPDVSVDDSNLRAQVAALRKALRDGRDGARYVATVPGRGYRFVSQVSRAARSSARPPAQHPRLPARLTRPVGRDEIVGAIGARLQRRRFLTVVGPGGIGKTTVALAAADALSDAFPDGVCLVDLAPLADAGNVPSALVSALALMAVSGDPTAAAVGFLRDRSMLIVLDSCEHVLEAAALLAERVLRGAAGVHVLATSREPLRAEGESVQRLAPLEAPPASATPDAAEALRYPAVELFAERAAEGLDGFELSDADAPLVGEICRRLDGIALAIELAARRVAAFGVAGVAAQLDQSFRMLTGGRRTALPRHQTLGAALDWSYQFLNDAERSVLRRLAVFAGGFGLEAACAVASDDGIAESGVVDALASLVNKSLVALDARGSGSIYRLLDTTRAYAHEKLAESGEQGRGSRRHAEYYRALLQTAREQEAAPDATAEHGRHIDDVRVALDWAFSPDGDSAIGLGLTHVAIPLWFQLSLVDECFRRVQQALESTGGAARETYAHEVTQMLGALGQALAMGFSQDAMAAFARALELAEKAGDTETQLSMLYGLWNCRLMSSEFREGLALAQRFAALAESSSEPADRLLADRLLGIPLHYLGEQEQARVHLDRMLESYVAPTVRAPTIRYQAEQRVFARATLSRVLWLLGLPEQATRAAERTVEESQRVAHPIWLFSALSVAACPIALLVGDLPAAERAMESMRDLTARHALGLGAGIVRCFEGAVRVARGDALGGLALLQAGLTESARSGGPRPDPLFVAVKADALARSGEIEEGIATLDDALHSSGLNDETWCMPELLRIKGELLARRPGRRALKLRDDCFAQALDEARRAGALSWELRCATSQARHARGTRRAAARDVLASVFARFSEGFESADLVAARRLLDELA
jgi:predicted ATPase/DNA-binding winged helix-turn-helix (wHTH) protein